MHYGDDFQRLSKYNRDSLGGKSLDWSAKPEVYKKYPPEPERFELETPQREGGMPLYSVLQKRRSERRFRNEELSGKDLSQILWSGQGLTLSTEHHQFRTAPSAGALYPIETYCVVNRVNGFKPGVYHYQVPYHCLVLLKEGQFSKDLARGALGQHMVQEAAFNLVWSAVIERSKWKYDQRAYRYIYMDAGHTAENTALAAVSAGLGSVQIGAFFDEEIDRVIGVDGVSEFAIYMTSVGKPL